LSFHPAHVQGYPNAKNATFRLIIRATYYSIASTPSCLYVSYYGSSKLAITCTQIGVLFDALIASLGILELSYSLQASCGSPACSYVQYVGRDCCRRWGSPANHVSTRYSNAFALATPHL